MNSIQKCEATAVVTFARAATGTKQAMGLRPTSPSIGNQDLRSHDLPHLGKCSWSPPV